jgi:hypothetical protein
LEGGEEEEKNESLRSVSKVRLVGPEWREGDGGDLWITTPIQ